MFRFSAFCTLALAAALGLFACRPAPSGSSATSTDPFLQFMTKGKHHLDQGEASQALSLFRSAAELKPKDLDLRLNLANAHLLLGEADAALREADSALALDPQLPAAYFIQGSALLRLGRPEEAAQALENVKRLDPGETATFFQLGMARMGLKQWDSAIAAFREGIALDPNHLHSAAHYQLSQALLRAGRPEEAARALQNHEPGGDDRGRNVSAATFERSRYTRARVPFRLDPPETESIPLRYVDATASTLGPGAADYTGPVALIDLNRRGWISLFVVDRKGGFRLLRNTNGVLEAQPALPASNPGNRFTKMLTGDLQNDRFEDVLVLGASGSRVFKFGTNGIVSDVSATSGLAGLSAVDGQLMDLDFTGKLDLLAASGQAQGLQVFRQFGPLLFSNITARAGALETTGELRSLLMEDWNRDGIMDVILGRSSGPPVLLEKLRGGKLITRAVTNWVAGSVVASGDFDNDLRPDLAVVNEGRITLCLNGGERREIGNLGGDAVEQLIAVDYDGDGWLDLWMLGSGIRAWRNRGSAGFQEQTRPLGLGVLDGQGVREVHFADFDQDCDSDVLAVLGDGGLRYLRNEGGQANQQLKIQLVGNRSNASGLGCKVEIQTGGLRLLRTVRSLPVEVGVGHHQKLDSFLVHWFNWPQGFADVTVQCREPIFSQELSLQEGSCPYLYAWDGERFRFVTDILGAAPLGLPVAEGRYVESDPEEFVWIGEEKTFPPRDGSYEVRITEELREVLYLDEAKLVVVDRTPDTEVHPTDKLLPGGPFPTGTLLTLGHEQPLRRAQRSDGLDVTDAVRTRDGRRASPPQLRIPQLRGLAEPHSLTLDFGPLDSRAPLVLVLNGWLRFGGGMANIAASHDPSLPFPFPQLEVEVAPDSWQAVPVVVGAPAGKTKTILVDLEGRLPDGARRLRLHGALEIHWDRIALLQKAPPAATEISLLPASQADLRFRGFSELLELPPDSPSTPDYERVNRRGPWTVIPGGWCTRYGDVREIVGKRDEGLILLNAGDELSLRFQAGSLPAKPPGTVREFFLYIDGWDKDSDFHVATGTEVEPLPFHGMNPQRYGRENRPPFASDAMHQRYNTRWVEGRVTEPLAAGTRSTPARDSRTDGEKVRR